MFSLSLKLLRTTNFLQKTNLPKFSINFPKYNFARKVKASESTNNNSNKKTKNQENDAEDSEDTKTINIVREDVPIKISPYFSKAVSDKEKSASSINISQLVEAGGKKKQKDNAMTLEEKQEVIKTKQKLTAAKKQSAKTIGVVIENIKRELPKEL